MSLPFLPVSPTVANIDQDLLLVVNWTPPEVNGGYTLYSGWNIYLATPPNAPPTSVFTTGLSFGGFAPLRYLTRKRTSSMVR